MAFSSANVYAPAITEIQAKVSNRRRVNLDLDNICFIFALEKDFSSGSSLRSDLAAVATWFEGQSWLTGSSMTFEVKLRHQCIKISPEPSTGV